MLQMTLWLTPWLTPKRKVTDPMTTSTQQQAAIIGAGIGGMSAAYDLARAGQRVTIYEASDHVGGLAAGFKEPHWDWSVERYYHHWFQSDRHMLGLIAELGWSDQVLFPRPVTVVYFKGRFYPFDSITAALLYPGLGWGINKIRFGLVGLFLRLTKKWQALEKTTADAWMRKWAGDRVYESMWEPMMIGKFGETYAKQVNMAWLWARLHARTTRLGTFEGGFQAFADRFAERLQEMGVTLHLETPIRAVTPGADGPLDLTVGDGTVTAYDQVLSTTSPGLMARLAPGLPESYLEGLLSLKSMGAVVMILSLKHPLSTEGYYWYNIPKNADFPFLSLVEHTNFLSPEHFGGDHIVYIGDYLPQDHPYFDLSKEDLLGRFLPHLPKFNSAFSPDWVKKTWLFRTKYAQPVPMVNHSSNIPAIRTPIPGLFYASMSQVYPWDRGTNFAVEIGRRAASLMLGA
jgi:protoporphyrinogen oxidase